MVTYLRQDELLAQRVIDAQNGQCYVQPEMHSLPGALRAIGAVALESHHAAGRTSHDITEAVNAQWREDNATRLLQAEAWITGTYRRDLERRRQVAIEMQAEEMRRRAIIEKVIEESSCPEP